MARSNIQSDVTLNIKLSSEASDQLEELANTTGQTKSYIVAEAIGSYLHVSAWQSEATERALNKVKNKNAKLVKHEKVVEWLKSWKIRD